MADQYYDVKTGTPVVLPVFTTTTTLSSYSQISNGAIASPTLNVVKVKRQFDEIKIKAQWGKGPATVSTTNETRFNMPSGFTISSADQPDGFTSPFAVGYATLYQAATGATLNLICVAISATQVAFRRDDNVPLRENIWASSDYIVINIETEITEYAGGMQAYGAGWATNNTPGLTQQGDWTNITVTGASWTTQRAIAMYYVDKLGRHRLRFNIYGLLPNAPRTSIVVAVSGVNFGPNYQAIDTYVEDAAANFVPSGGYSANGAGNLALKQSNVSGNLYMLSGDVELVSKPTWAT